MKKVDVFVVVVNISIIIYVIQLAQILLVDHLPMDLYVFLTFHVIQLAKLVIKEEIVTIIIAKNVKIIINF